MRNAVTTGISEDSAMDSDSVNLGSNPSPPATQIIEKKALSCPGLFRSDGLSRSFGRTEPGTLDQGFVYFVTDGDAIKIGFSQAPKLRLSDLQTSTHKTLQVLGTVPAMLHDEGTIHGWFAHLRIRGEWFRPEAELSAFIEKACKAPEKATRPPPPPPPAGTAPHIRSLLDMLDRRFPDDRAVTERTRMIRRHLALEAGGKAPPAIKQRTTDILCELGDMIAERAAAASTREETA